LEGEGDDLLTKAGQALQTRKGQVADGLLLMQVSAFMQVVGRDARAVAQVTGPDRCLDVAVYPLRAPKLE
jgi:hypothetical protein